jgi:predicted lipoprotein with Yx(FWY)xxD motif
MVTLSKEITMKRLMTLGTTITAALAIAACGSNSGATSSTAGSKITDTTVSVRHLSGVGSVLVDHAGEALYTSDQEAGGKIVCNGACNAFWKPLTLGGGKPTASTGAGQLGVITRPDGRRQVTVGGKPLYTFVEDSPGKATGNAFTDDFNGHHFTWNVVHTGGTAAGAATSGKGAATPNSGGGSGGGYGY